MLLKLLWPGARGLSNQFSRGTRHDRVKFFLFGGLGLLFWGALFGFCIFVLKKFLGVEVFGIYLVKKLMGMLLLSLFGLLCFSNLVAALSSYFLADDLALLRSLPISVRQFHRARFTQTFLTASAAAGIFGTPVLMAYGVVFSAPPLYYLTLVVYLVAFLAIPTGVGIALAALLVSIFPARRTRDLIMVVSFVFLVGLLVFIRYLQPERLVRATDFSDMIAFLGQLQAPTAPFLPGSWGVEVLMPLATGTGGRVGFYLLLTLVTGLVSLIVSGWITEALFFRAFTRAQEGSGEGDLVPGLADRLLVLATSPLPRPMQSLLIKDIKSFFRDSAEWPQLLLIMALMAIYLYSIKVLPLDAPLISWNVHNLIAFMNLGMVGFVLSAIAVRFLFTSVSVEGRAFWLLRAAPLSPMRFLMSKYIVGVPLLMGTGLVLITMSNWMLGSHPFIQTMGVVTVVGLSLSLAGLSVGMGALYPNFKAEHIAKIASGPGGMLFMLISQIYVAGIIALESVPVFLILRAARRDRALLDWELGLVIGLTALALLPMIFGAIIPMRRGARHLAAE